MRTRPALVKALPDDREEIAGVAATWANRLARTCRFRLHPQLTRMAALVLVKHSLREILPEVISHRWVLSQEGRDRCKWLATEFAALGVMRIYASLEPKALETAALTAAPLGLDVCPRQGLQENDRQGLGFGSMAELDERMKRFFDAPSELVIGTETAQAALQRFETAVRALASEEPGLPVAVVTHGTVLSLFVAKHNRIPTFEFWKSLGVPSCVRLDRSSFKLEGPVRSLPG
jgi:broad specificity phosphatase PhoE